MKKNIIIVILVLINVFFFFYSYIKANEAQRAAQAALEAKNEATVQASRADQEKLKAQDAAAMAKKNEADALKLQRELDKCQNN